MTRQKLGGGKAHEPAAKEKINLSKGNHGRDYHHADCDICGNYFTADYALGYERQVFWDLLFILVVYFPWKTL
jgi:hypothetical protein